MIPQLQLDYWFTGGQGEENKEDQPVIVLYEKVRGVLFGHKVEAKGADPMVEKTIPA